VLVRMWEIGSFLTLHGAANLEKSGNFINTSIPLLHVYPKTLSRSIYRCLNGDIIKARWSVSPKLPCWNLILNVLPWGGAREEWLNHEGSALRNEVSTLMKEFGGAAHPPCEDLATRYSVGSREQNLTRHRICCHFDFGLPNLQKGEK
jgi:hypothetical protein